VNTEELLAKFEYALHDMTPPVGEFELAAASFQPDDKECTSFRYEFHFVRKETP